MLEGKQRAPVQNDMVRELNRQTVLQVLGLSGSTSRAQVAKETGLSVPTVNTIVREFIDMDVLREVGAAPSAGGRPAKLVRLDPGSRLVLALDLNGPRLRAAVLDLYGEVVCAAVGPVARPGLEQGLIGFIEEVLAEVPQRQRVVRLAVAVPGVIDPGSGHVRLAPTLGWDDFDLRGLIEPGCGVPVTLENDVNAVTLAELHYGLGRDHRYLLCVAIGSGIGAGLVVDGQLYRGATAAAGEIGYSRLAGPIPGEPLQLGSPGPLERQMLDRSRAFVAEDGRVDLSTAAARAAFDAFAADFGLVMHNLACLVNPELLVISWPADEGGLLVERLQQGWCGPLPLPIRASALGPDAALRGVARLAIDEIARELCASAAPSRPEAWANDSTAPEQIRARTPVGPKDPAGRAVFASEPVTTNRTTRSRAARRSEE